MADILADLFDQFSKGEQAEIKAARATARTILAQGDRAVRERAIEPLSRRDYILKPQDEARANAACAEFVAYQRALARRVDPLSPESVEEFLRQLEGVGEGLLKRYGCREGKDAIDELRAEAERLAWLSHAKHLVTAKAEPAQEALQRRKSLVEKYRTAHELTTPDLARRTGASVTAIQGMVRGDRRRYSEEKLANFLKVIGVPHDEW